MTIPIFANFRLNFEQFLFFINVLVKIKFCLIFERTDFISRFTYSRIILVNLLQYTVILGVTNLIFDNFRLNFEQFLLYLCSPVFCGQFFSEYWVWMLFNFSLFFLNICYIQFFFVLLRRFYQK